MELQVVGKSPIQVSDAVFGTDYNEGLVHQVVTAYMAGSRQGTVAQKTRSEVSGGGAKPWRQKGTGRARAGTSRSPLWRSGGQTFAAKPRNYDQKVNKKMYRKGLSVILSELARKDRLKVVEDFKLAEAKTKVCAAKLKELNVGKTLIMLDELDENLVLAARNLPNVMVTSVHSLDPLSLVAFDDVVVTVAAVKKIEEKLS